jgi:hypothetical protein
MNRDTRNLPQRFQWGLLPKSLWLMAILCTGLAGCTPDSPPVDAATQHVLENARTFNTGLASAVVADGELKAYVNAVGARLYDAAMAGKGGSDAIRSPVQVDLLSNPVPLAFTLGGEHVYISVGAVRLCSSEEDLAAMLAHLYAHLLDKHQQKHEQVDSSDLLTVADTLAHSPRTDDEERAADLDGFSLFARAGWDPSKYPGAWLRLGGGAGHTRADAILRGIADMPRPSDEWRKTLVADHSTFRRLLREAGAISDGADPAEKLLMRSTRSCVGNDNSGDRESAVSSLDLQMPAASGGGGRTEIGPKPVQGP